MRSHFALFLGLGLYSVPLSAVDYQSQAKAAYMIDMQSGAVLFDKDGTRRIPTASMAKMMTAYVAFQAIKAGKLKPEQKVTVSKSAFSKWNGQGSTMFLRQGESVSVENLLDGILTLSGNDAAIVLAEAMAGSEANFTKLMNAEAKRLNMRSSHFNTANGWPDEGKTYSTAQDLSILAQRIIYDHPKEFQRYFGKKEMRWNDIMQPNRNPLLGAIPGADGLKTGHSDEAGYCLAGTVKQGDRRLLMVVAGLETMEGRLNESRRFVNWGFSNWQNRNLFKAGAVVGTAPVQLGSETEVNLIAPRNLAATLPKNGADQFALSIRYSGPIKAPFKKGDQIADLIVHLPDGKQQIMPLVADQSVAKAGFLGRTWNGFKRVIGL